MIVMTGRSRIGHEETILRIGRMCLNKRQYESKFGKFGGKIQKQRYPIPSISNMRSEKPDVVF